jgi:hypothetical protein
MLSMESPTVRAVDERRTVIRVTAAQVQAARIEVQAFRSAGLEPDPMVVRLANATPRRRVTGAEDAAGGEDRP